MKKWTEEELLKAGYKIENAIIETADLSMADHGCLTLRMVIKGSCWGSVYGGYVLGHGYVGAAVDYFDGSGDGMESIIRIMDIVGVNSFQDLENKYIRVCSKGRLGDTIKIIGNIIKDKWFDYESFYKDKESEDKQ